jgi:hypothetical protein
MNTDLSLFSTQDQSALTILPSGLVSTKAVLLQDLSPTQQLFLQHASQTAPAHRRVSSLPMIGSNILLQRTLVLTLVSLLI